METEIGVPIDYTPEMDFKDKVISREKNEDYTTSLQDVLEEDEPKHRHQEHSYQEQSYQEPMYYQYPQQPIIYQQTDALANMNKTSYIILGVVFVLGYFFGKSFQPVIIRPG
jgi:hypothetical protein